MRLESSVNSKNRFIHFPLRQGIGSHFCLVDMRKIRECRVQPARYRTTMRRTLPCRPGNTLTMTRQQHFDDHTTRVLWQLQESIRSLSIATRYWFSLWLELSLGISSCWHHSTMRPIFVSVAIWHMLIANYAGIVLHLGKQLCDKHCPLLLRNDIIHERCTLGNYTRRLMTW
jgi:hypothetical protein